MGGKRATRHATLAGLTVKLAYTLRGPVRQGGFWLTPREG